MDGDTSNNPGNDEDLFMARLFDDVNLEPTNESQEERNVEKLRATLKQYGQKINLKECQVKIEARKILEANKRGTIDRSSLDIYLSCTRLLFLIAFFRGRSSLFERRCLVRRGAYSYRGAGTSAEKSYQI